MVEDGRLVTTSVKWWAESSKIKRSELFCIHNERLDIYCQKCAEHDG